MIRAPGFSRRARRIAWRAWRSASAVTAQVLRIIALPSPASAATRAMIPLSNALSRHPNVMISTLITSTAKERRVDRTFESERRRPRHDDMAVVPPEDLEIAAVERNSRVAAAQPAAMGGDESGASAGAAGLGNPGSALPDT